MKKHDTLDKVKFRKVFLSSYNEELIASLSYFDFYDANYKDEGVNNGKTHKVDEDKY